jgi:hypothetical protein
MPAAATSAGFEDAGIGRTLVAHHIAEDALAVVVAVDLRKRAEERRAVARVERLLRHDELQDFGEIVVRVDRTGGDQEAAEHVGRHGPALEHRGEDAALIVGRRDAARRLEVGLRDASSLGSWSATAMSSCAELVRRRHLARRLAHHLPVLVRRQRRLLEELLVVDALGVRTVDARDLAEHRGGPAVLQQSGDARLRANAGAANEPRQVLLQPHRPRARMTAASRSRSTAARSGRRARGVRPSGVRATCRPRS